MAIIAHYTKWAFCVNCWFHYLLLVELWREKWIKRRSKKKKGDNCVELNDIKNKSIQFNSPNPIRYSAMIWSAFILSPHISIRIRIVSSLPIVYHFTSLLLKLMNYFWLQLFNQVEQRSQKKVDKCAWWRWWWRYYCKWCKNENKELLKHTRKVYLDDQNQTGIFLCQLSSSISASSQKVWLLTFQYSSNQIYRQGLLQHFLSCEPFKWTHAATPNFSLEFVTVSKSVFLEFIKIALLNKQKAIIIY